MRAKNKIFHLECFRCVACDKQLVPGDEFALRPDGLLKRTTQEPRRRTTARRRTATTAVRTTSGKTARTAGIY
jgi:hypothetical protein